MPPAQTGQIGVGLSIKMKKFVRIEEVENGYTLYTQNVTFICKTVDELLEKVKEIFEKEMM